MKNKKRIIFFITLLVILGIAVLMIWFSKSKPENDTILPEEQKEIEEKKEEIKEIQELKEETGASGQEDIYELQEEPGGRKVLAIKPSIQYQVAFAGAILRRVPTNLEEVKKVAEENELSESGIWIAKEDRETFLEALKEVAKNGYEMTESGYLMVSEKSPEQNEVDQKLEGILASQKTIVITMTGELMTVDSLTGQIMDNPFAQIDGFQPYDYVKEENRIVISLSDNRKGKLTKTEILMSAVQLLALE